MPVLAIAKTKTTASTLFTFKALLQLCDELENSINCLYT